MDRKRRLNLRSYWGMGLLATLLLAGLLTGRILARQQEDLARRLEDCTWQALSGQWQQARDSAEDARQHWERHRDLWAALGDHQPMDEIDAQFSRLKICAAAGEQTEFALLCAGISQGLRTLAGEQLPHWWHVL